MPHWVSLVLFFLMAAGLTAISFEPPFRSWAEVSRQEVYSEAIITLLLFTWVILLHRIKLTRTIFWVLYTGFCLMALGALEDVEDEFLMTKGTLSQLIENIATPLGMLLISIGLYLWGSEQKRSRQQLQKLSETDALTGLGNRASFNHHLERAASGEQQRALLFLDIDNFKQVNDTHGHARGDQVIQQLALTMKQCIREQDLAFRYGGEEFAILLEGTHPRTVELVAQRIMTGFSSHLFTLENQQTFSCTVSIGIAHTQKPVKAAAWLDTADQALYTAKERGKDRAVLKQQP